MPPASKVCSDAEFYTRNNAGSSPTALSPPSDGNKIDSIERVMLGKTDGRIAYAVLSFGDFLGIGNDHYPLPWNQLSYDTSLGGYRINLTEDRLEGAPKYGGESWDCEDRERACKASEYHGSPWMGY